MPDLARTTRSLPLCPARSSSATAGDSESSLTLFRNRASLNRCAPGCAPRFRAGFLVFIDEVVISVKAGDGGNGCSAFRREKFVPKGGPSGGDGGRGGDVKLVASEHYNTLLHFRFNPEHTAERGRHGEGSNRTGRDGESIELPVPVGTIVYDADSGEILHDFTQTGDRFTVAHGGRGGRGNQHFATPTHQAPTEHEAGKPGEERHLRLELKLLADVGLVGFPNAGKSTLISRI